MGVKRRRSKRKEELSANAEAWLRGEPAGFFPYKLEAQLRDIWNRYGDKTVMEWPEGAVRPEAKKAL